jgi:diguanylate cyclase (GGDEF)-like protein
LVTEALETDIDAGLKRESPWAFPPLLEAQYQARNNFVRRGQLMTAMAVAGVAVLAGIPFDALAGTHAFNLMLLARLPAALACLIAALALHHVRRTWQETLLLAVPMLAALMVTQYAGEAAAHDTGDGDYADRCTLAVAVGVAALLLLPQWRFRAVMVTSALAALALPLVPLLTMPDPAARPHLVEICFGEFGLLLTLVAARRQETARRTIFLHVMRNELAGMALDKANAEVVHLSTTDPLTGFVNRRHFDAELARMWRDRGRSDVGLALIEIDSFSDYIETAGPAEADNCLREVSRALAGGLRQNWDRAGRWQDAAFAALLPTVERDELSEIGERLRRAVAQLAIPHPGQPGRFVSISVGLAWSSGSSGHATLTQVLQDADAALFAAKSLGPNRVVLSGDNAARGPAPSVEAPVYFRGTW